MSGTHRFVAALAALLLLAGLALGQVKSSTITGTVTDPSGALVPGAEVLVTNQETNVTVAVQSNAAGEYTAPPAHGPRMALICGITPLASVLRRKISAYPASDATPS